MSLLEFRIEKENKFAHYSVISPFIFLVLSLIASVVVSEIYKNDTFGLRQFFYFVIIGVGITANVFAVCILMILSYLKKEMKFKYSWISLGISLIPIALVVGFF